MTIVCKEQRTLRQWVCLSLFLSLFHSHIIAFQNGLSVSEKPVPLQFCFHSVSFQFFLSSVASHSKAIFFTFKPLSGTYPVASGHTHLLSALCFCFLTSFLSPHFLPHTPALLWASNTSPAVSVLPFVHYNIFHVAYCCCYSLYNTAELTSKKSKMTLCDGI